MCFPSLQIKEQVTSRGISSVLAISEVKASDAGQYRCLATNAHASDEAVYSLLVLGTEKSIYLLLES